MRRHILLLAALVAPAALAWGPEGHEISARIAERLLDAKAKARVAAILGPDRTLASVSTWADSIRESRRNTGSWHYVNAPVSRREVEIERACRGDNCVVAKLNEFAAELRNPNTSQRRRLEALMYVVHLAADLNNPMHAGDNGDQGGNQVRVAYFGRNTNLHSLWDGAILRRMGSPEQLFSRLVDELTPRNIAEWRKGSPETWVAEAHEAAREVAYGRLPQVPKGRTIVLSEPYARFAEPAARTQLLKAAVRIAEMIQRGL